MTKDERELIREILMDHPSGHEFFDGKRKAEGIPSARDVYKMLGKEYYDERTIQFLQGQN